jgi:hypothetical protein
MSGSGREGQGGAGPETRDPSQPAAPEAEPTVRKVEPDPRAAQAIVDKAVADAAKAQADADKAAADVRSARAKADKDERDAAWSDTAQAKKQREAESRKATAEAEKSTAAADRDRVAALIPDFSKVERGSLELKGDQPLFASPLANRALDEGAETLVTEALEVLPQGGKWRVLVTSDAELATSHAAYIDVVTGLDQLFETAEDLIDKISRADTLEFLPVVPAIAALAGAVPGLLSLFSAHRTVTTAPVTVGDLAAAAATAGALKRAEPGGTVVHDDFRVLETSRVHQKLAALSKKREELVGHRIALESEKTAKSTELEAAHANIKEITAQLQAAPADAQPALRAKLKETQDEAASLEQAISAATVKLGLIESVQSAIDAFVASLTAVPEGGKRSPLAQAAMREHLHDVADSTKPTDKDPGAFTHVLLVKGNGGSAVQTVEDRPLWWKDKFAVIATASITYMLLETAGSSILAAGNLGGSATGFGSIGDQFELEVRPRSFD